MNFDRNTVIGFIVLAVLFIGYFFYTSREQQAYMREKARLDSIAATQVPIRDTAIVRQDSVVVDSINKTSTAGGFATALNTPEQLSTVENKVMKVVFTTKGGQPKAIELKNYQGVDANNVKLASTEFDKLIYRINTGANQTADIVNFNFTSAGVTRNADGSQTITFQLQSAENTSIVHQYVIKDDQYMIDFNLQINGINPLLTNNEINLTWQNKALQLQKDLSYEKQQSQISYRVDEDHDYTSAMSSSSETFTKPISWVAVKQQFFNSAFIARDNFSSGTVAWVSPQSGNTVVEATANLKIQLPATSSATIPLAFYYGPNEYKVLKQYDNDMEEMVNLGTGVFAFVKYINRWIVLPAFDFFRKFTSNYGIVILLLTLFIRLLISPLTYKSYLSGAKMKALKPEIEQLKAKHGGDQQAMSMEQMKLFREAGVNPLGGCIPALFQIPIFFALYSFFNSNVALRGQGFLWADDLSQYDSILSLPFSIPFYGDHVSLFTITATLSSLVISVYSMSMTPDQGNPVLKYMPYIFPVILLFVFNSMPSGLTWYYTVSNIITLILQFVIQNYIIDHNKILAKIAANKKKPKVKTKWQLKMEELQEQQKKLQQMQQQRKK